MPPLEPSGRFLNVSSTYIELIGAVAGGVVWIAVIAAVTPLTSSFGGFDHDGQHYAMLFQPHLQRDMPVAMTAPFCWRPGAPFLASRLPLHPIMAFKITGLMFQLVTLVILFFTARVAGLTTGSAYIAQTLYAGLFYTVKFTVYSPCYIDWGMMPFLASILFCLYSRRFRPIPLLFAIGVVFKETIFFCWPSVGAAMIGEFGFRRSVSRLAWVSLPAVIVWLLVRFLIPSMNVFSPVDAWLYTLHSIASLRFWSRFPLEVLAGLGILPMLLLHPSARRFFRGSCLFNMVWVLSGLIIPFCGSDKSRLFLFSALPMSIIGAAVLWKAAGSRRTVFWAAGSILLHGFYGHQFESVRDFNRFLLHMAPIHTSAAPDTRSFIALGSAAAWIVLTIVMFRTSSKNKNSGVIT